MSKMIASKTDNIDGVNTKAIGTITPCVGGLIVWYEQASALAHATAVQEDNTERGNAQQ
jgi:hypothetical protein